MDAAKIGQKRKPKNVEKGSEFNGTRSSKKKSEERTVTFRRHNRVGFFGFFFLKD